jgi:hypothetical protein
MTQMSASQGTGIEYLAEIAAVLATLAVTGCGPRWAEWQVPAVFDVGAVTRAVMDTADADGDGLLDPVEFAALPALEGMVSVLDTDGDRRLSTAEIEAWLERVRRESVAACEAPMLVTHQGAPLADALVKLVPEPCMAAATEPAEGRTEATGLVFLNTPTRQTPGVRPGLYRVEITGKGADGKPLPAKYNSATTLGYALGGGLPSTRTPLYALD